MGGSPALGGCGCRATDATGRQRGQGSGQASGPGLDEPTAIIPLIDAPELVRPYIHPTELLSAEEAEVFDGEAGYGAGAGPGAGTGYEDSVVPGIDAPHMVRSSRARVLAGQLVSVPAQPGAEVVPYTAGGRVAVRRGAAVAAGAGASTEVATTGGRPPGGRRRARRGRRALLITAGALGVAVLGTAAALAPRMINGGDADQAQPQPGVTLAMPTAAPATATAGTHAAAPRPSGSASQARPTVSPTAAGAGATPSATAGGQPSSAAPHTSAPNQAPPASATGGSTPTPTRSSAAVGQQSLSLGDQGPAVATLQSQLASLWIDHKLRPSGTFDTRTELDVATFQVWYGVQGDPQGVFGPNSQARMNSLFHH
ncbi:peptidoglycan-binding domain-containing protein [Streptacidiphilus sp. N1-12]|uniref:Peptidoglycan-binding domain-containing protein n=2 Tax=Streptacidiphilus alkalitolerans TaxID=3342712 RepID=A0ABV6WKH7_9ACTN